jgi:hypothetical protein
VVAHKVGKMKEERGWNQPIWVLWQPAQENTVLSPKTDPLWSLSSSKVSSCRWLPG